MHQRANVSYFYTLHLSQQGKAATHDILYTLQSVRRRVSSRSSRNYPAWYEMPSRTTHDISPVPHILGLAAGAEEPDSCPAGVASNRGDFVENSWSL
jgi:hypothetical protein